MNRRAVVWAGLGLALLVGCSPATSTAETLPTLNLGTLPAPVVSEGQGFVILGDSLTEQSTEAIRQVLPQATVDAFAGRAIANPFLTDTGIDRAAPLHELNPRWWVVALGTNDAAFAIRPLDEIRADIGTLLDAIGRNQCVLWVLPYVTAPVTAEGIERTNGLSLVAVDELSGMACHATLQWSETVLADPSVLGPDGVHLTETGTTKFAAAIASAIAALPAPP